MAYDDTSFNGDLIVDEYDGHNNFIGTNTPSGFLVYHLLGDGFDLMAEQCSKFMNDFSILSASASSLDKFWGVSYNMPRPSLDTLGATIFEDKGTIFDYNRWSGTNSSTSLTRLNDYTELKRTENASTFAWINKQLSVTDGITIEFDLKQATLPSSNKTYFTFRATGGTVKLGIYKTYENLADGQWHHYRFDVNGLTVNPTIDGVQRDNLTLNGNFGYVQFDAFEEAVQHFKNFVVYDRNAPSTRPMTDEEYRVYLYLRNCRLLTREDLLINMQKCFGLDDYEIVLSDEAFYLEATDHPNYEAEDSISSNLHKRDDDTTLHFVTDFTNDETTETIESGLSEQGELVTVINIPYNEWDGEFLEFLEQYVSVKGNLKIKEYHL